MNKRVNIVQKFYYIISVSGNINVLQVTQFSLYITSRRTVEVAYKSGMIYPLLINCLRDALKEEWKVASFLHYVEYTHYKSN